MRNILIDPVLLMTPAEDASKEEVEQWLKTLEIWLQEALSGHFNWLHLLEVTSNVMDEGRFPSFGVLRQWQKKYSLNINLYTLAHMVNKFFTNPAHDLQKDLDQIGYLIETENNTILVQPEQFLLRWSDGVRGPLCTVFALLCICKHTDHPFTRSFHVATSSLPDKTKEVQISFKVVYAVPEHICQVGETIAQALPLLLTPDDLFPLIDVLSLWQEGEQGILYAIQQYYKKDWGNQVEQPLDIRLGRVFLASVEKNNLHVQEIILTKIVRASAAIIAEKAEKVSGYKLHPLRENVAGNSPQHVRASDGAKAWRLDLTMEGAGWRLHYWRISTSQGGVIELSNVCKEGDNAIY